MKLRSIQVLRGVAASGVVLLHATQAPWSVRGGAGVDLFFVISGFVMASIPKRPSFLFDRFWRIYPLWWIAVLPWLLFTALDWRRTVTSLTLWPIIGVWQLPALRVGWTLSFEMLFYFAVYASIRVGVRPLLALFAAMLVGAVTLRWPLFDYLGSPMIFEFLFGVLVARLPKRAGLAMPLLLVGLVAFAIAPTWVESAVMARRMASAWRVLYWGVPAALVVYACVAGERAFAARWWVPALVLGDASYSIYLFHTGIIALLPLWWPLQLAAAILGGVAIWRTIERPLLRLKPRGRLPRILGGTEVPAEPLAARVRNG